MHLNAKIDLYIVIVLEQGAKFRWRSNGVTWSDFFEFMMILHAKFESTVFCWYSAL